MKEGWKPGQRASSWALTGFRMVWKCQVFEGSAISPPPSSLPIWASPLLKSWLNIAFLQEAFPG